MDKEEFNQSELQNISEFQLFRAELFNVSEHSRPRMETYHVNELKENSLPEKPIAQNEPDLASRKAMQDALNSTSGASSTPSGLGGTSGLSGAGAASSSAAAGSSTAATVGSTVGAAATTITTVTAALAGAAIATNPIINDGPPVYGTYTQENYVSSTQEIEGEKYQILEFNFDGELKEGYTTQIKDNTNQNIYPVEGNMCKIQNPYDKKSYDYTIEILDNKNQKVLFTKDILVESLTLDFDSFTDQIGYRTRYNETSNDYTVWYYFNTSYQDSLEAYKMPRVDAYTYLPSSPDEVKLTTTKVVDNSGKNDIFKIENVKELSAGMRLCPYLQKDENLFMYETHSFLEMNDEANVVSSVFGQQYTLKNYGDDLKSDVEVDITHDDGTHEQFVVSASEVQEGNEYKKFLSKYSLNPKIKTSYSSTSPERDPLNIIPDDVLTGSNTIKKMSQFDAPNNLQDLVGTFTYDHYETKKYSKAAKNYHAIDFKFTGEIDSMFKAQVVDKTSGTIKEVAGSSVIFENPDETKSLDYSYELVFKETNEVIYKQDISVQTFEFDYSTTSVNVGFKTRYNPTENDYTFWVYYDTPYQGGTDGKPFTKMDAFAIDSTTGEEIIYNVEKVVDNGGINDIYRIDHVKNMVDPVTLRPYMSFGKDLISFDYLGIVDLNDDYGVSFYYEAQRFNISYNLEDVLSDVQVSIKHDDGTIEEIVAPLDKMQSNATYGTLLSKYSEAPETTVTYKSQVREWDFRYIIPEDILVGETSRTRTYTKPYDNNVLLTYGSYAFDHATSTSDNDPLNPGKQLKRINLHFVGDLEPYYYVKVVHPETNVETKISTPSSIEVSQVPVEMNTIKVNIYNTRWTTEEIDDVIVRQLIIDVTDAIPIA